MVDGFSPDVVAAEVSRQEGLDYGRAKTESGAGPWCADGTEGFVESAILKFDVLGVLSEIFLVALSVVKAGVPNQATQRNLKLDVLIVRILVRVDRMGR